MKQQKVFLLVGAPASGKSSWANAQVTMRESLGEESVHISRDNIRFNLLNEDEPYFSKERIVFSYFITDINHAIERNFENIYIDATHINAKSRSKVLNRLNLNDNTIIIPVVFTTTKDECLIRNLTRRGRACVPDSVIKDFFNSYTDPKDDCFFNYYDIWYIDSIGKITTMVEKI